MIDEPVRRLTLHELGLVIAERFNPGGEHCVTGVEFDGTPDPDDPEAPYIDVRMEVATRVPLDLSTPINVTLLPVDLSR